MIEPLPPATPPNAEPEGPQEPVTSATSIDETGEASFPASDPPAVWTWEVDRRPPESVAD